MELTTVLKLPLACLGLILLLAACASDSSVRGDAGAVPIEEADAPTVYQLSPGDKLQISVFGEPDLSGEFDVNQSGDITFPLLGQAKAAGQTVDELRETLSEELNAKYLVDPKVSVEVLNYRPFYVLGEVNEPGSYEYKAEMTIRQAVALAGGFTRRAVTGEMIVIRLKDKNEVKLEVAQDARVLPGDTIEIQRRFF